MTEIMESSGIQTNFFNSVLESFINIEKGENLAVVPYRKKDFHSHRVPRELYSNTRGMEISSLKLCQIISQKYNWNPDSSYRVPGKVIPEKGLALFFLARGEAICDEIQRQKGLTWTRPDLLH